MFVFTQVFTLPQTFRYTVPSSVLKRKHPSQCLCCFCCRPEEGFMNSKACTFFPAMLMGLIKDTNGSTADLVFSLWSLHVERAVFIMRALEML